VRQIGLDPLFPNEENPFPWMSEMIDLKKERNFFETRVIDYQTGGALEWDVRDPVHHGDRRVPRQRPGASSRRMDLRAGPCSAECFAT
jgi:hypothetical protein